VKKVVILLILSLALLLVAASMQTGATGAKFSDKTTSVGNKFEAADSW
jgi:hypothetical protein